MVSKSGQRRGHCQDLGEIARLLSQHSLAYWPSFLEELKGEEGVMIRNLYSVFASEPLHNLH